MVAQVHKLTFPGAMNERGFWLYVRRVESPVGELLYVGRTGDEASANAASPIKRMGITLDEKSLGNMLRRHIEKQKVALECCDTFQMIAYGPLFPEVRDWGQHVKYRDKVAAIEKKLADTLALHYKVMNEVNCRRPLDEALWQEVRQAFTVHFPQLAVSTST